MSFSIQLNEQEEKLFKSYADFHGISLDEAFKNAVLEKIVDEYDIVLAEQAHNEFVKDPQTVSHEKLMKELGLWVVIYSPSRILCDIEYNINY